MILDITITVQEATTANTTYVIGVPTTTWTASQTTVRANRQPIGGEIGYKDYGVTDESIKYIFFCKRSTAVLTCGDDKVCRVIDNVRGDTLEIVSVEHYPDHYEIMTKPVVT